jgi:hypothetical protein
MGALLSLGRDMLHSVNVDHDEDVFVFWLDDKTGITMKMTPEEAITIGEIGEMARLRKAARKEMENERPET